MHFCAPHGDVKTVFTTNFPAGECLRRRCGAGHDGGAPLRASVVNGFGIDTIVIREDLSLRSGGWIVVARFVDRDELLGSDGELVSRLRVTKSPSDPAGHRQALGSDRDR